MSQLAILAFSLLVYAAPANLDSLPKSGQTANEFVPSGWSIESEYSGDLTNDGIPDLVLVLLQTGEGDRARALIILAKEKNSLRFLGRNKQILQCYECGGIKGGTAAPEIDVKKNILIVSNNSGSRETSLETYRFRLSPQTGRLMLIGLDIEHRDSLTGAYDITSDNYLTGQSISEKLVAGQTKPSKKILRIEKRRVTLDELSPNK